MSIVRKEDGTLVEVTERVVSEEEVQGIRANLEQRVNTLTPQVEAKREELSALEAELDAAESELEGFTAATFHTEEAEPETAESTDSDMESTEEVDSDESESPVVIDF